MRLIYTSEMRHVALFGSLLFTDGCVGPHMKGPEAVSPLVPPWQTVAISPAVDGKNVALPACDPSSKANPVGPAQTAVTFTITPTLLTQMTSSTACASAACFSLNAAEPVPWPGGGMLDGTNFAAAPGPVFPVGPVTSPLPKYSAGANTPLDIDLRYQWRPRKDASTDVSPILVRIALTGGLTFLNGAEVVRGDDPSSAAMLDCQQPVQPTLVQFRVKYVASTTTPVYGAINIGVNVPAGSGLMLPLILDPKIPDNG